MKKIGLLGGSFDPPHNAHLALACVARDHLGLDELRLVPAGDPWQKSHRQLAAPEHRARMVEVAIEDEEGLRLDDSELRHDGPSYSIDTVERLQAAENADWFFVIGQDQYANLHTWHRWHDLLSRVTLAVAAREGQAVRASAEVAAVPHRMVALPLPAMPVSSSDVRARLSRGENVDTLVPPAVASYIDQNHLYRS